MELSRQLWHTGQEPFEGIPEGYSADLFPGQFDELNKCLRTFDLVLLLGSLFEFIEVHVKHLPANEENFPYVLILYLLSKYLVIIIIIGQCTVASRNSLHSFNESTIVTVFITVHIHKHVHRLVESLALYWDMTEQSPIDSGRLDEFPDSITVPQAVATWKHVTEYKEKKH